MPPIFTRGIITFSLALLPGGEMPPSFTRGIITFSLALLPGGEMPPSFTRGIFTLSLSMPGILSPEELFAFRYRWLDGAFTFLPIGWASFTVLFCVLQCLDHSKGFINTAS